MKQAIEQRMKWINDHVGEALAVLSLLVTQLLSYARLRFQHSIHGEKLTKIEDELKEHIDAGELHRNPDFERGIEEIRTQIIQANAKLDRLIERRN